MIEFPIGLDGLNFLIDHRSEFLSHVLSFFTWLGEDEGYILIITGIYLMHDKTLAVRLAFLVLVTMCVNHLLKMLVGNPRPFVTEGTFTEKWLVDPSYASELATEYSTPSGHAMSAFVFYGYLLTIIRSKYFKVVAGLTILLIGLSRPYLGVHYMEDILLGWTIALLSIVGYYRYSVEIQEKWSALGLSQQLLFTLCASLALWIATYYLHDFDIKSQPLPFVGHMGFIMGLVLGSGLEMKYLSFDPKIGSWTFKIIRWFVAIILVMLPLLSMDNMSMMDSSSPTLGTHLIQYMGYVVAGFMGIFMAPWLAIKLGLLNKSG